ncbi:hypothetical protein DFH07DRAFT_785966 [Mycena maculata]|uniref:Uncharacterized protein n=1 Tax=Mycena maculata TaxID=230809 RepID=A0AAD7H6A2_9AGAR|nr:hypothetical protein DFH07DRAFT_785966 [Mycena maculata]
MTAPGYHFYHSFYEHNPGLYSPDSWYLAIFVSGFLNLWIAVLVSPISPIFALTGYIAFLDTPTTTETVLDMLNYLELGPWNFDTVILAAAIVNHLRIEMNQLAHFRSKSQRDARTKEKRNELDSLTGKQARSLGWR